MIMSLLSALLPWSNARRALIVAFAMVALAPLASATELTINGSPLLISASEDLAMRVFRQENHFQLNSDGLSGQFTGVITSEQQYFSTYNTFIRRSVDGVVSVTGGSNFTAVPNEHVLVDVFGAGTTGSITTRVTTPDGLSITQVVTYINGQQVYQHTWTVTNIGNSTFTGVALRYGGDSFFYNSDRANGFFDPALGMVFCTNNLVPGLMGMFGAANTPATHHYEDGFSNNGSLLQSTGDLPDTVNPAFIDNGMSLQWDHGNLAPGETYEVTAFEKWTDTGLVQVLAPALTSANPNTTLNLSFTVQNLQNISDTFSLTTVASSGLTISAPGSVQLSAGGFASVPVQVTIGQEVQAGALATVTMTAVAASNGTLVNQDTARLSVVSTPGAPIAFTDPTPAAASVVSGSVQVAVVATDNENLPASLDLFLDANGTSTTVQHFTSAPFSATVDVSGLAGGTVIVFRAVAFNAGGISSSVSRSLVTTGGSQGPVVTVTTPALGVSSGPTVVYNAICPSTPEGLARLRSVLAGKPSNQVRAFSWDAIEQAYVEFPTEPSGGLNVSSGVFIATRLNLGLDFSGGPSELPYSITLKPGYNFVGLPPFIISGSGVTGHAFLDDFSVTVDGTPVTDPTALADLLGTVGSGDPATAQPFFWNGTAYVQQATLASGLGYWIKNNQTTGDVVLTRVDQSRLVIGTPIEGPVGASFARSARSVATHQVIDRGTPPPPPGGSGSGAQQSSGGGCGHGSFSAGMLVFALLFMRLRRLHGRG